MPVQNVTVKYEDSGIRIDRWFQRHFPEFSHNAIEKALRKGQIKVDGKKVKSNYRVEEGQVVRVPPVPKAIDGVEKHDKKFSDRDIELIAKSIIYEDNHIIVINKPQGLAVQGGSKVTKSVDKMMVQYMDGRGEAKLVHRIDRDTSGILVLAKSSASAAKLTEMFRNKDLQKIYLAVTAGVPVDSRGEINMPLIKEGEGIEKVVVSSKGQKALTLYKVIDKAFNKAALIEASPVTGRTHQIRVHLEAIGCPILGDGKYGGREAFINGVSNKLHLHAYKMIIPGYFGKVLELTAPPPPDFKATCKFFEFSI